MRRRPVVSSLSMAFKKATNISDDVEEVKKEHRSNLNILMNRYMEDVQSGKAEGVRTAREFVDLIKTDMLLLGEVTERNEEISAIDQVKIDRLTSVLDEDSPEVQSIMDNMFEALNSANDEFDQAGNEAVADKMESVKAVGESEESEEDMEY